MLSNVSRDVWVFSLISIFVIAIVVVICGTIWGILKAKNAIFLKLQI